MLPSFRAPIGRVQQQVVRGLRRGTAVNGALPQQAQGFQPSVQAPAYFAREDSNTSTNTALSTIEEGLEGSLDASLVPSDMATLGTPPENF